MWLIRGLIKSGARILCSEYGPTYKFISNYFFFIVFFFLSGLRKNKFTPSNILSNSSSDYDEDSGSDYIPYKEQLKFSDSDGLSDFSEGSYNKQVKETETATIISDENISDKSDLLKIPQTSTIKRYNFEGNVETSKIKGVMNKRVWDKTDHCIYCEKDVTNFTRHLLRKHKEEIEVSRYCAFPKNSKERKFHADLLRKKGNFLNNIGGNKLKPVRRPNENKDTTSANEYLPCKHCYGMYKKNHLYRHIKICKNNKSKSGGRVRAKVDGQNMLLVFKKDDENLLNNVFERMIADEISLVVKKDDLIKQFGSRYLKAHKEKHLINVVSQKMRLLARFLMSVKLEDPSIST